MTKCTGKHTLYQPTEDEFVCPDCGAGPEDGGLSIDQPCEDAFEDCDMVHIHDELMCYKCGYEANAASFVRALVKRKELVKCPCCKGKGFITPKIAKEYMGEKQPSRMAKGVK